MLPPKGELLAVACRALLGSTSITLSYYALKLIPLGDATTIRFSLPIWTLIISYLLLGESCSLLKVFAVVVSVSGVVLIARPDDCLQLVYLFAELLGCAAPGQVADELSLGQLRGDARPLLAASVAAYPNSTGHNSTGGGPPTPGPFLVGSHMRQLEGCLMALASSICLSMSLIAMRLCRQTPAEITIMWLSISSIVVGTCTLAGLNEWRLPDNLMDLIYILLNGLCGAIGQWFITSALKIEQSGIVALARTFDIEVAFLYSALLLHEHIRATR